jgi:hypothetical protein
MKSIYLIISVFLITISCNQKSKQTAKESNSKTNLSSKKSSTIDTSSKFSETEDKILDLVFNLPEVKERAKYIEDQTKGKNHINGTIEELIDSKEKSYLVKIGEDNGE